jgi:hypothetical protein
MRNKNFLIFGVVAILALLAIFMLTSPLYAGKLEDAIAKCPVGDGPGLINPGAAKGFMGIPGAPQNFWLWGILWGIWVGWIFSSVDAFGKSFFTQMALSAGFLWPVFIALAWMQLRFFELEFPLPFTSLSLGFIGVFILIYIPTYVLFNKARRKFPYFRRIRAGIF